MDQAVQLPEPEVAREEDDALAAGERRANALLAFDFDVPQKLAVRLRARTQHGHDHPAEMHERLLSDAAALAPGPRRKRRGQLVLGQTPMPAVHKVEDPADRRPHRARQRPGQAAGERPDGHDDRVLEAVSRLGQRHAAHLPDSRHEPVAEFRRRRDVHLERNRRNRHR